MAVESPLVCLLLSFIYIPETPKARNNNQYEWEEGDEFFILNFLVTFKRCERGRAGKEK